MTTHFVQPFLTEIGIPNAYIPALLGYAEKLASLPAWDALAARLLARDYKDINELLAEAARIGETVGCHRYSAHFLLFVMTAEDVLTQYRARGIDEGIYWDSMRDLRYKFHECLDVHGVPGSFVAHWFPGFFHLTRFALGRLQYEHTGFRADSYTRCGITLHKGDDVLNCHIPSCGPLTEEARLDSYRRAHAFYRRDFPGGVIPIVCSSWLLYPAHKDFLPPHSNILSFMGDFDIISSSENKNFSDGWRVFGAAAGNPPEALPRDTSLRRAFADRLSAGLPVGSGYGILLFDGEKILR